MRARGKPVGRCLAPLADLAKTVLAHPERGRDFVTAKGSFLDAQDKRLWRTGERSPRQSRVLTEVTRRVRDTVQKGQTPVVIADIDDTTLLTPLRMAVVFSEFGVAHGVESLVGARPKHFTTYGFQETLVNRLGLDKDWVSSHREMKQFWLERFFSDPYLLLDMPAPGAPAYFTALHRAGAHMVYITGRDGINMRRGTEMSLRLHKFPHPGQERVTLNMKGEANQALFTPEMNEAERRAVVQRTDLAYKRGVIERALALGPVIAAFDNESAMANLYRRELGETLVIRVATVESGAEALLEGIEVIYGYSG